MQHSKKVSIIFQKKGWWQNSMKFREKKSVDLFLCLSQISRGFKVFTQNSWLFTGFNEPKIISRLFKVSRSGGNPVTRVILCHNVLQTRTDSWEKWESRMLSQSWPSTLHHWANSWGQQSSMKKPCKLALHMYLYGFLILHQFVKHIAPLNSYLMLIEAE